MPRIAVTLGDPAGVGPELCLRLLGDVSIRGLCVPLVFGDAEVLARCARHLGWSEPETSSVVDLRAIDAARLTPGVADAATGAASFRYVQAAIAAAMAGDVDALVTAPIHKEALHAAGIDYPGHTEMLAEMTAAPRIAMMLTSREITCSLVTTHVGYGEVPALLTTERIVEVIELTHEALSRWRGRAPRLAVCGLNPHAGEHGLFGRGEEEQIIAPAIAAARERGIEVEGPLPPDTAFIPERRARTDGYICMYHDQGLIPLKALAFDTAVNVTLGLPIIRTSVDHGTALDIAWQGKASATSMLEAVKMAAELASRTR